MNQQGQHVVSGVECMHVILEAARIDRNAPAPQHPHDIPLKPFKIHIHIDFKRFIGFRGRPVI